MRAALVSVLGSLCGVVALVACADLTPSAFSSSSSASSTALVRPLPEIEITTPARGAFLSPGAAAVEGWAAPAPDGPAIERVRVNGVDVTLEEDGTFRTMVDLTPGINVITASARDGGGLAGTSAVGVLAGSWNPMDQRIPAAAAARINGSALDGLGGLVESLVRSLDLDQLTQATIFSDDYLWMKVDLALLQPQFQDVAVRLHPGPDGIHFEVTVFQPVVGVSVLVDMGLGIFIGPEQATAAADTLVCRGRLELFVRSDQRVGVAIEDFTSSFQGMWVAVTSQSISLLEPLIAWAVQRAVERYIDRALVDHRQQIETGLDQWLTPDVPFDLFGIPIPHDIRAESISFDSGGMDVQVSFDAPPPHWTAVGSAAPGSFRTPGTMPALQPGVGATASIDDDAVNRLLHGAWATGLLEQDLDQAWLADRGVVLPTGGVNASALKRLLPELGPAVPDGAPLMVRVRGLLPPLFEVSSGPNAARLHLGEVQLELLCDRGSGWEPIFLAALHVSAGANVELGSHGLQLGSAEQANVKVDLLRTPLVPLDTTKLEGALQTVLTPIIPRLINAVPLIPIPHVDQLSVINIQAFGDGPAGDHLTVTGEIVR